MLATKELLYKMADDALILGHRNSEWTGLGPMLEEDISFSSMAQDKLGHSLALYSLLHELGEADPDTVAFTRNAPQFHCCQLVELPTEEYEYALIRHLLFDHAESLRYEALATSSYEPLAKVARKFKGELKYHVLHANTWLKQLGSATAESIGRLQAALDQMLPYALGIFEAAPLEEELIAGGVFVGENALRAQWIASVTAVLSKTALEVPDFLAVAPVFGGRRGEHTPHLQPLLEEMSAVFRLDPSADW
ncbi:MAG: phenylacetate-CoA oxygenase subunit PaaC [Hymenobacteraceae bacterium]|nr:phenylacetate-CoA oxygenase subunit PaaC [Hymenobacteraceae bacterium]